MGLLLASTNVETAYSQTPREGYVESDDAVRLFYRTTGAGRDTIVVIHGGPGLDMGYLAPDLEPLSETHVLIFYDQRGSGRSTLVSNRKTVNLDKHLLDIEAVRANFGIDRMILFGHSWGALLAARYAFKHPEHLSAMVLISPSPLRYAPYMDQLMPRLTAWMDRNVLAELNALMAARRDPSQDAQATCRAFWKVFAKGYFADPESSIPLMRGDFCNATNVSIRNRDTVNRLTWESMGDYDWRKDFQNVDIPVLIITGTKDIFPIEAAREWEAAFPNSRLILMDASGHYPHIEQPSQFFHLLEKFFNDTL